MKVTIEIDDQVAELLAVLAGYDNEGTYEEEVAHVLARLVDHAQQGVYRPGAWERSWITQVFGDEFTERLETFNAVGHQRPRRGR